MQMSNVNASNRRLYEYFYMSMHSKSWTCIFDSCNLLSAPAPNLSTLCFHQLRVLCGMQKLLDIFFIVHCGWLSCMRLHFEKSDTCEQNARV